MDLLCHFLNIPYNTVSQHESPDCIIELEGRKIGVEITTLRPSSSLTKLLSGRAQGQNKNQIGENGACPPTKSCSIHPLLT